MPVALAILVVGFAINYQKRIVFPHITAGEVAAHCPPLPRPAKPQKRSRPSSLEVGRAKSKLEYLANAQASHMQRDDSDGEARVERGDSAANRGFIPRLAVTNFRSDDIHTLFDWKRLALVPVSLQPYRSKPAKSRSHNAPSHRTVSQRRVCDTARAKRPSSTFPRLAPCAYCRRWRPSSACGRSFPCPHHQCRAGFICCPTNVDTDNTEGLRDVWRDNGPRAAFLAYAAAARFLGRKDGRFRFSGSRLDREIQSTAMSRREFGANVQRRRARGHSIGLQPGRE